MMSELASDIVACPSFTNGRGLIHLEDRRMLSVEKIIPKNGSPFTAQKLGQKNTENDEALEAAVRMSASQEAKAFVAGRIVPNFEAIDDRTRQVPFYGILTEHGGQTRIKFFYARPRSVDTPAPLSLIALSAKKPRQEYALPSTIAETAI